MALKISIIGLGVIGKVHAEALSRLGTPALALCDIVAEKAEAVREKYAPDAKIYTDWREMLRDFSPDVVHICTPHDLHAEMAVEALGSNIHVLCEKPLCINEEQLVRILDAEKQSLATLGVCFQNRYTPANQFLKHYLCEKKIVAAHGSVVWHRDEQYYRSAEWRGTLAHEGGGVLINQAIHTLDLLCWICGEPSEVKATADCFTLGEVIEVEDTLVATFDGTVPFTFFATNSAADNFSVTLHFKSGSGEKISAVQNSILIDGVSMLPEKLSETQVSSLGKEYYGNAHGALFYDFYKCIEEARPFPICGEEAAKVMRLVFAAYRSRGEKIAI